MESSPDGQKFSYVVSTNIVDFFSVLERLSRGEEGTCEALASMISVMSVT